MKQNLEFVFGHVCHSLIFIVKYIQIYFSSCSYEVVITNVFVQPYTLHLFLQNITLKTFLMKFYDLLRSYKLKGIQCT